MRQAGRSLPEYRALRQGIPMLESCTRPELVTEITLQPVRRYGVDAAILFSDIMVPLKAIGVDLDIVAGVGPVVASPVRTMADLSPLRPIEAADVAYVAEAVTALVRTLGATPLIGFAGAPFTLASYLVEGGPSRDHAATKALMYGAPEVWHALLSRLAVISATFLRIQVEAGASAVQLFDSWAGSLAPEDYDTFVRPHSETVLRAVADLGVPRIHFGVGTGELLPLMASAGADVVGIDWRVPLRSGIERVGLAVRCRATSILRWCSRRGRSSPTRRPASSPPDGMRPGTSSTSVTGCCRRRTRTCWLASSTSSTPSPFVPDGPFRALSRPAAP